MKKRTGMKIFKNTLAGGIVIAGLSTSSAMALTFPEVTACSYDTVIITDPNDLTGLVDDSSTPGQLLCYRPVGSDASTEIYVASQHDDFISYSANALKQLSALYPDDPVLAEWANLDPQGSGQLLKLFTYNQSNNQDFPDQTTGTNDNDNGSSGAYPTTNYMWDTDQTVRGDTLYYGTWPNSGEMITIGQLEQSGDQLVFVYDLNDETLLVSGKVEIWAEGTTPGVDDPISLFAFDNIFNSDGLLGAWDGGDLDLTNPLNAYRMVAAIPEVEVEWYDPVLCADTGNICSIMVDNNVGSGKPDFYGIIAPELLFDFGDYADNDFMTVTLSLALLNERGGDPGSGGGEELSLLVAEGEGSVPVPAPLAMLGLGLIGLAYSRMRS